MTGPGLEHLLTSPEHRGLVYLLSSPEDLRFANWRSSAGDIFSMLPDVLCAPRSQRALVHRGPPAAYCSCSSLLVFSQPPFTQKEEVVIALHTRLTDTTRFGLRWFLNTSTSYPFQSHDIGSSSVHLVTRQRASARACPAHDDRKISRVLSTSATVPPAGGLQSSDLQRGGGKVRRYYSATPISALI